jgi:hypothetical protein
MEKWATRCPRCESERESANKYRSLPPFSKKNLLT